MVTAENNPFSVSKIHNLPYHFSGSNLNTILRNWSSQNYRGIIKGKHGVGKSTLLKELVSFLESRDEAINYIFLNNNLKFNVKDLLNIFKLDKKFIVVIDGWEQIGFFFKILLFLKFKRLKGFIGTSHQNGIFPVIFDATTDFKTFSALVAKLTGASYEKVLPDLRLLYDKHNGNIRDCLFELYDFLAN